MTTPSASEPVTLTMADGGTIELPVESATEGGAGLDISKLLARAGVVTFDPGFANTAPCRSAITYIDGEAGILRYRGYPIEALAHDASFSEVIHLLLFGELPTADQLAAFESDLRGHAAVPDEVLRLIESFPSSAHPMSMLSAAVSALAPYSKNAVAEPAPEQLAANAAELLGKLPTVAAAIHRHLTGQPIVAPDVSLDAVTDFLRMTFATSGAPFQPNPAVSKALDMLFVLHADHEQNCSTSTVRLVGSSQATLFASISAGIDALSGPLHGGANQAVIEMLETIRGQGGDVASFVRRVKEGHGDVRLMGFGHRVYKAYDPRATIVKQTATTVLEQLGKDDQLLDLAMQLEEVALSDDYFVSRHLYPNVDFYTGILYRAMGFPTDMFTVLFALGRAPGWIAHWIEMTHDPQTKIGRPRQIYSGHNAREFVPVSAR